MGMCECVYAFLLYSIIVLYYYYITVLRCVGRLERIWNCAILLTILTGWLIIVLLAEETYRRPRCHARCVDNATEFQVVTFGQCPIIVTFWSVNVIKLEFLHSCATTYTFGYLQYSISPICMTLKDFHMEKTLWGRMPAPNLEPCDWSGNSKTCWSVYVGFSAGYSCACAVVQELCESRDGRPWLSVLTSLLVSVDVKIYWTVLRHWSQLVPNMSANIWGH